MRVLVTGGAGFIGSHIVDRLVERGDEVVILDSLDAAAHARRPDYLNPGAEFVQADLRDQAAVERALRGVTAVCHQAARVGLGVDFGDVERYVGDNDAGTASLLHTLWKLHFAGRLVVASSMVVYGEGSYRCAEHSLTRPWPRLAADLEAERFEPRCPTCGADLVPEPVTEDAPLDPRNVYAATKLHTEHLATAFGRESEATVCALRYHNVYGPRMPNDTPYAGVASIFRSALEAARAPAVFEDGAQLRDFVHVDDVARANLCALTTDWSGAVNVASGAPHTIGEMAQLLAASFGDETLRPIITGRFRLGDVRHVIGATNLAATSIGYRAEVDFATGIAQFARAPLRTKDR